MSVLPIVIFSVVLELSGFKGSDLSVFSKFDNNNVKLGDPMKYEVVFKGDGDFTSLRAPQIGKVVDRREWKVDMFSVKTTTFEDGKVFEYTMRPLTDGVVYFPEVQFSFGENGQILKTQKIPVSVKKGEKVVLIGTEETFDDEMAPSGIVVTPPENLSDDEMFVWRKACRTFDPELFAKFDFPVSKLNEASCWLMRGQWAKALKIYRGLEWRIGQTEEVERGIMCCISGRTGEKFVQLPVWREAFRFVLKYDWKMRVAVVLLCALAVALAAFLFRRLIKVLAVLALVVSLPCEAHSFSGLFESIRARHNSLFSGFGSHVQPNEAVEVKAEIALSKKHLVVGESFAFNVSLEVPEKASLHSVKLDFDNTYALTFLGGDETLSDEKSNKKGYLRKRFKVYARYDAPVDLKIQATIGGMVRIVRRYESGGMSSVMSSESSFSCITDKLRVNVMPLDSRLRPEGFSGVVGSNASFTSVFAEKTVCTNDVVAVEYVFQIDGFIPDDAFEGVRQRNKKSVTLRSYFVADGRTEIPPREVAYYDTESKSYKFARSSSIRINYTADDKSLSEAKDRAVDAEMEKSDKLVELRFAPYGDAPVIGKIVLGEDDLKVSDKFGSWVRVSAGGMIGWMKK